MREWAPLAVLVVTLAGCTGPAPDAVGEPAAVEEPTVPGPDAAPAVDAVHLDACKTGEVTLLVDRDNFEGYLPEGFHLDPDAATGLARIVATVLDCDLDGTAARAILPVVAVVPPDARRNASADLHGIQLGVVSDNGGLLAALRGWGFRGVEEAGISVDRFLLPSSAALHVEADPDFLMTVDAAGDAAPPAAHRRVFGMRVAQGGSFLTGALDLELAMGTYRGGVATVSFLMGPQVGDVPYHEAGLGVVGLLDRDVRLRWVPL